MATPIRDPAPPMEMLARTPIGNSVSAGMLASQPVRPPRISATVTIAIAIAVIDSLGLDGEGGVLDPAVSGLARRVGGVAQPPRQALDGSPRFRGHELGDD